LQADQQEYWSVLQKELVNEGVYISHPDDLSANEIQWLEAYFEANMFPVLTPLSMELAL